MKIHHPFCNFFRYSEAEDCEQCKYLYENFPINENTSLEEIIEKKFPSAVIRHLMGDEGPYDEPEFLDE